MRRVFNFNAGPAMLPEEVLEQARDEMLDWDHTGMSVMEIGHRTALFKKVAEKSEADLRELMDIPEEYAVLFLAGGASVQFAMVPLNLFNGNKHADYIDTGVWSKKAIAEASRYGEVNVAAQAQMQDGLLTIPKQAEWNLNPNAAYVHYTPNETIDGLQFHWIPKTQDVPLVADMTSMILSQTIDVNRFGIIYAGAQKNMGMAGLNVVIIRKDLIKEALEFTPTLYKYKTQLENHCFYNTPPTYNWYMAGLVFAWMKRRGGIEVFNAENHRKAEKLYYIIDRYNEFYNCRVAAHDRSTMNVMFYLRDEKMTPLFLEQAAEQGLINLQGHRVSGGVRASIYNAMPEEAIDVLAKFMVEFAMRNG